MKYSFSPKLVALALAVGLLSFTAASQAASPKQQTPKIVLNTGAVEGIKHELDDGGVGLLGGQNLIVNCTYKYENHIVTEKLLATYLGYTFMSYEGLPGGNVYNDCLYMGREACSFLTHVIGIPQPLNVTFTGSVINTTKECNTF